MHTEHLIKSRKGVFSPLRWMMVAWLLWAGAGWPVPAVDAADFPKRIVSLAPNLTEILFALGVEARIAAVTDYCDYPPGAAAKPRIGGFANPSLEAIVMQRPDLVVMTDDGNPRLFEHRLKSLGIRTYIFRARRIGDLPDEVRAMGRVLGVAAVADGRADWFERRVRSIAEGRKGSSRQGIRSAVFIVQPNPLIAAGRGTTIDDALSLLGVGNVAAAGKGGYPKFSLEEIIRLGPDALFFGKGRGMEERTKPLIERFATLDAVRSGRVFFIGDAIYRLGLRIVTGLEEMAACLDAG